jgi:glycosyltransferase involved in cell wall biosynthesis
MNRFIIESERWAARITDRLVVVAAEDRKKGLAAGVGAPERYVLIESSIPLDTFDPSSVDVGAVRARLGIPDGAPVAGTVGRFAYQKAPEIMLEAARKILESQPDAHFVYVGDGPLRDEVLSMMGEFAGHPRLHLAGVVTDVAPLVAGFDVFLLSSRYEGLPRVVVEAMALEKPVVSTPADGVVEVVRDGTTGIIVPHGDAQALADAALSVIRAPDRGRSMGRAARAVALKRFDLDSMISRTEKLYESLLVEKGLDRGSSRSPQGGADLCVSSRDR